MVHLTTNVGTGFYFYKVVATPRYFRAYTSGIAFMIDGTGSVELRLENSNQINTRNAELLINYYGSYSNRQKTNICGPLYAWQGVTNSVSPTYSSDKRIKKNIVDSSGSEALDKIRKIESKRYDYIDRFDEYQTWGWIAQQVKKYAPVLLKKNKDIFQIL